MKTRRILLVVMAAALVGLLTGSCGGSTGQNLINTNAGQDANIQAENAGYQAFPPIPEDRIPSAGPVGDPELRVVPGSDYLSMQNGTVTGSSLILAAPVYPADTAWGVYRFSYLLGMHPLTLVTEAVPLDLEDEYYIGVANYTTGTWEWFGPTSMYEFEVDLSQSEDRYISTLGNFYFVVLCATGNTITHSQTTLVLEAGSGTEPPDAPTGLVATDGLYADRVELAWVESGGADGYAIWRTGYVPGGPDEDGWEFIANTDTTTYADYDVVVDTAYFYKVQAFNAGGYSGYSNVDAGYAHDTTPPPTTGTIRVAILPAGEDFANMTVYLAGLPEVQTQTPNVYGVTYFGELPLGNYLVTVHHAQREFSPGFQQVSLTADQTFAMVDFTASEVTDYSVIRGFTWRYVEGTGYQGIYGSNVLIEKNGFPDNWTVVTDGYGSFTKGSLETNRYYWVTPTRTYFTFDPETRPMYNYADRLWQPMFFKGNLVP